MRSGSPRLTFRASRARSPGRPLQLPGARRASGEGGAGAGPGRGLACGARAAREEGGADRGGRGARPRGLRALETAACPRRAHTDAVRLLRLLGVRRRCQRLAEPGAARKRAVRAAGSDGSGPCHVEEKWAHLRGGWD